MVVGVEVAGVEPTLANSGFCLVSRAPVQVRPAFPTTDQFEPTRFVF